MSLEELPNEIVFNILLSLPYTDVINYCETNSRALSICGDESFWRIKAEKDFGLPLKKFKSNKDQKLCTSIKIFRWSSC